VPGKPGWTVNQTDTKALIENIYDTPLTDIAAKLNEFRDQALGHSASTQTAMVSSRFARIWSAIQVATPSPCWFCIR